MPGLYIITGSNGAGKSTVGPGYLPEEILQNYRLIFPKIRKLDIILPLYRKYAAPAQRGGVPVLRRTSNQHALYRNNPFKAFLSANN